MKILHVIPSLDPALGGPPRIAVRLAAGAASLGHSVSLLSYETSPQTQQAIARDLALVPGAQLLHSVLIPSPSRLERFTASSARKKLGEIIPEFDIVHTHDVWSAISRSAMAIAVQKKVPFVLLPNGMFDPWSLNQKRWKKLPLLALGYRKTLNEALFIHTGNVDEKAGVQAAGIKASIEIIPNGIYPQEFDPLPPPGLFYAAYPQLCGKPYVLFLSRLHYKKGLDYLAAAFTQIAAKHPDVQLVVAGPDDGAASAFGEAIHAAGLDHRVHVIGPIFSQDRYHAMIDSTCFCLPSRQEGFSIAILEAMACATPVVISQACHFPEVATAGAGAVVSLQADEIAQALDRILCDPAHAKAMGNAGRKLVMNQYTWPTIAAQLIAAYQRHLNFKIKSESPGA